MKKKRNHLEKNGTGGPGEDHQEFMKSNKLILKTQRGFWSEKCNLFTGKINKVTLSSNYDRGTQSIET